MPAWYEDSISLRSLCFHLGRRTGRRAKSRRREWLFLGASLLLLLPVLFLPHAKPRKSTTINAEPDWTPRPWRDLEVQVVSYGKARLENDMPSTGMGQRVCTLEHRSPKTWIDPGPMYIWPEYCAENSPLFNRWNAIQPDGMRLGGWDAAHGPVLYHIGLSLPKTSSACTGHPLPGITDPGNREAATQRHSESPNRGVQREIRVWAREEIALVHTTNGSYDRLRTD
jgi:hypothetical protein